MLEKVVLTERRKTMETLSAVIDTIADTIDTITYQLSSWRAVSFAFWLLHPQQLPPSLLSQSRGAFSPWFTPRALWSKDLSLGSVPVGSLVLIPAINSNTTARQGLWCCPVCYQCKHSALSSVCWDLRVCIRWDHCVTWQPKADFNPTGSYPSSGKASLPIRHWWAVALLHNILSSLSPTYPLFL